jgi:hypothetical protein
VIVEIPKKHLLIVDNGTGRVNFLTGKGKRKKYLGVVVK